MKARSCSSGAPNEQYQAIVAMHCAVAVEADAAGGEPSGSRLPHISSYIEHHGLPHHGRMHRQQHALLSQLKVAARADDLGGMLHDCCSLHRRSGQA
jgi:hypothetical protein